jgi:hypothetical protein
MWAWRRSPYRRGRNCGSGSRGCGRGIIIRNLRNFFKFGYRNFGNFRNYRNYRNFTKFGYRN